MKEKAGMACIYVHHYPGFFQRLRPAYDSAPTCLAHMTEREVSTMKSMIARYAAKCQDRRKRATEEKHG